MEVAKKAVFNTNNAGVWFSLGDGARIKLRLCTGEQFDKIREQTTEEIEVFKNVEGTPARFDKVKTNTKLENELFWDYVIETWENVANEEGILECTKENKIRLINRSPQFVEVLSGLVEKLRKSEVDKQEKTRKN